MKTVVYLGGQSFELNYDEYIRCPFCKEKIYGGLALEYDRCPTCCHSWN